MYLAPNRLQSRVPSYSEETVGLEMDGQRYRAVMHIVTAPNSTDKEPVYVSAANGFDEDPQTWRPLTSRLAKIAKNVGQQMVLVTYEDSAPNGVQDILAFRAERLAHAIRSTRVDGKLVMGAHSRGWVSTVLTAAEQQEEIAKLVGFGVAGLAPRAVDGLTERKIKEITTNQMLSEVTGHMGPIDIWDKLVIGQRFAHNSLSYLANHREDMYREGSQILSADVIHQTVALSEQVPTTIWVHGRDAFFNPAMVHENLANAGYQGETRDVATSHLGPIIDFSLAQKLYEDLTSS